MRACGGGAGAGCAGSRAGPLGGPGQSRGSAVGNLHPDPQRKEVMAKIAWVGGSKYQGKTRQVAGKLRENSTTGQDRALWRLQVHTVRWLWTGCGGRGLTLASTGGVPCVWVLGFSMLSFVRNSLPCLQTCPFSPSPLWSGHWLFCPPQITPGGQVSPLAPALDLDLGGLPPSPQSRRSERWAWEREQGHCKRNSFPGGVRLLCLISKPDD